MNADIIDQLFSEFGKLVLVGGSGAAFAGILFKSFGENWLSHQFNKKMEAFKTDLYLLSARHKKLQDKEYEVFPEMWAKLMCAKQSLLDIDISHIPMPDFSSMGENEIIEWIKDSGWSEIEKRHFLHVSNKEEAYEKISNLRKIKVVKENITEFKKYAQDTAIFLSPDIKKMVGEIEHSMSVVRMKKELNIRTKDNPQFQDVFEDSAEDYRNKIIPKIDSLEDCIQKKLFPRER
jgi:hypothetical protein